MIRFLRNLFKSPASQLSQIGKDQQRAFVRDTARQLAAELGKTWPDDFVRRG